jgi:NAD(P)-dependent dehydrogenase (short-subunit alcohol dehydrogenase family)
LPNPDAAVIPGATGGIGPAIVNGFVNRGDHVVAVTHDKSELDSLDKHDSVSGEVADLTRPDQVEELWKRIDDLNLRPRWLINVTGGWRGGDVVSTTPEDFRFILDLNLTTAWLSCRSAIPRLKAAGGGSIVNFGSRSALLDGQGEAAYAVAKAAVVRLTQVLAAEVKDDGITVNAVLPAIVDTPANRGSLSKEVIEKAVTPEEIAGLVLFLTSKGAAKITGAAVPLYGNY